MKLAAYFSRWFGSGRAGGDPAARASESPRHPAASDRVAAWMSEGDGHYERGDLKQAAACFERVLEVAHDCGPAHYGLGLISARDGDLEEALDRFLLAVSFAPGLAPAHRELGAVFGRLGRLEEAREACERACALDPADPQNRLAAARAAKGRGALEAAERHYRAALEHAPGDLEALCNLGHLLDQLGRCADALACYERAIALAPDFVEAIHNRGVVARDNGELDLALACFERARALRPDSADIRFNHALALLAAGHFATGWREYEARFDQAADAPPRRPFDRPVWQGEALDGKAIVVWGEQGIGDEIFFAGMYPELVALAGRCVFECSAKLAPLFARSFPRAIVVPRTDPPQPATRDGVDFQIAAGSLGAYLRPARASFPARTAYLVADGGRAGHWRERLAPLGPGLKVGFAWRSSNLKGKRALACAGLEEWSELFAVPGVHWISLQYDECGDELQAARRSSSVALHRLEDVDYYDDLDGTAALMAALDLVISAPTVVSVHAAALGVPVWQLSYGADWQTHGETSQPWYPAMTRHARRWNQTWTDVISPLARRLREASARRMVH